MKKKILLTFLLIIGIIIIVRYANKTAIPYRYKTDNENFKQSVILLNKSRSLANTPESENQPNFELSKETEEKILLNIEEGIRLGKLIDDDYLDYLHPKLKDMFKNKLLRGTEVYYDGLMENNINDTVKSTQKQTRGNQLVIEWINWFDKNGEIITDKVFED